MRYALSRRSREFIRDFAGPEVLLAFDFDGTLAPIVEHPEFACMRRHTRVLLTRLARRRTCLVLSGRERADLRRKVDGCGIRWLAGNHGADLSDQAPRIRRDAVAWKRHLAASLPAIPGLWVEDKGLSLTIHYRQCRNKRLARESVARAVAELTGVRLVDGKESVSLVAPGAPDKGSALRSLMLRLNYRRAIFVGDDETDEDVFTLRGGELTLITIRVGRKRRSAAAYFLRNHEDIDGLLRLLLDAALRTRTPE